MFILGIKKYRILLALPVFFVLLFLISLVIFTGHVFAQDYCDEPGCYTSEFDLPGPCSATSCYYGGTTCGGTKDVYIIVQENPCYEHLYIGCGGCRGGGCFVGDTQITTPDGQKAISDIKEGDMVVGLDTETGEKVETPAESVYELEREGYYEITVEKPDGAEEILKVTGEHPLFVKKTSVLSSFFSTLLIKISNLFGI